MKRILALIGVFLVITIGGIQLWLAAHPSRSPLVVPGASDLQVVDTGVWEEQLTYGTSGAPYAWYWTVAATLEGQDWTLLNRWRPDTSPTYTPVTLQVFERQYLGLLRDQVVLDPEQAQPSVARIHVRRRIDIPGWFRWP
jgi:hypothetical protein